MKTQTIYVDACTSTGIAIGRRNTYATEQIVFGLAALVQQYGAGSATLMVLRPTDTTPYPAVTSQSGTELTWTVSATDTSVPGTGECELYWYVNGGLAKSVIFPLTIQRDIITEPIDEPPEPYQTWVDDLTDLGAETLQNAQAAAQSATEAELSKEASEDAARQAEEALEEFTTPTASAETLNPGEPATATYSDGHFTFGIPKGAKGDKGNTGETYMLAPSVDTIVKNPNTGTFVPAQIIFTVYKVVNGTSSPYRAAAIVADIFGSGMVPHYEVVNDYRLTVPINSIADTGYVACSAYGNGGIIATITIPCILDGAKGDPGEGVAPGGTTGQFLKKKSGTDYDTEWADVDAGVTSVNGKTGAVTLTASDVGAKPASYEAPVSSVNEKTGAVVLDAGDIGYDGETTYPDASVGKELGTINSALTSLSAVTEIIDTASGAIASFPDGAGLPMRSLLAQINPVQDLHGYENPWPTGGGKNKFPVADWFRTFDAGSNYLLVGNTSAFLTAGTYTVSFEYYVDGATSVTSFWRTYSEQVTSVDTSKQLEYRSLGLSMDATTWTAVTQTFTLQNDGWYGIDDGQLRGGVHYRNIQVEAGSTATAWTPYSNICPISGWTGLEGQRTGANLFDQDTYFPSKGFTEQEDGSWYINNLSPLANVTIWENTKGVAGSVGITYQYKNLTGSGSSGLRIYFVYEDGYTYRNYPTPTTEYKKLEYTTDSNRTLSKICWDYGSSSNFTWIKDFCIKFGTDTTYSPYTGEAISVSFGTTVYGGSDEVIGGDGTSTMAMVDLGTLDWALFGNTNTRQAWRTYGVNFKGAPDGNTPINALCNIAKAVSYNASWTPYTISTQTATSGIGLIFCVEPNKYANADEFKTAMSGVQLCYELATPTTFTHEGQSVDTLVGQNNVWVDTGDVSVTYQASIKGYIDKVLAS